MEFVEGEIEKDEAPNHNNEKLLKDRNKSSSHNNLAEVLTKSDVPSTSPASSTKKTSSRNLTQASSDPTSRKLDSDLPKMEEEFKLLFKLSDKLIACMSFLFS